MRPSATGVSTPRARRRSTRCAGCSATSRAGTPTCTAASSSRPTTPGRDLGVLFWHKDGYSTACGHGTIALGAWAVETGRVAAAADGETDVTIDVPSGRVVARVRRRAGAVESVTFRNVPAFVVARGVAAAGVRVDVAYGGAIYARVPAARLRPARGAGRPAAR